MLPVSRFSGPLEGWKALGGVVGSGKALKPLLGLPCGFMVVGAVGVALAVPLPSLPVFRPVGCWWFLPCTIASLFERLPFLPAGVFLFPTARPFGWLCFRSWLLVAALGFPSPLATVFCLSGRVSPPLALGRRWGVWDCGAQFLGNADLGFTLVFLLKESVKYSVKRKKHSVTCCFIISIFGVASAK